MSERDPEKEQREREKTGSPLSRELAVEFDSRTLGS